MDLGNSGWLLSGILVGSTLDTTTTLVLIALGIVIVDRPLPDILGGQRPQEIIKTGVSLAFRKLFKHDRPALSN